MIHKCYSKGGIMKFLSSISINLIFSDICRYVQLFFYYLADSLCGLNCWLNISTPTQASLSHIHTYIFNHLILRIFCALALRNHALNNQNNNKRSPNKTQKTIVPLKRPRTIITKKAGAAATAKSENCAKPEKSIKVKRPISNRSSIGIGSKTTMDIQSQSQPPPPAE